MKITTRANIVKKLNGAKLGTRFYFSNGFMLFKTRQDMGFSGAFPCYKEYRNNENTGFYWAKDRAGNVSQYLEDDIDGLGNLIKIEILDDDGYWPTPLFT